MIRLIGFSLFLGFSSIANANVVFFDDTRITDVTVTRGTVGTSTGVALAAASIGGNIRAWKICNDAVNTSTFLLVGKAVDVTTDGVELDKGQCFECPNCTKATLEAMRVEAQASSNGYSVIQYRSN